jgi:protocatechuate 3,4-dioxygenase beta subunit
MAVRAGWRLAALAWFGCFCANAGSCVLSGVVFNSATNAGIARALVSFGGAASGFRFTDPGGNFRVEDVPCGQYSLTVSKPGFVSEGDLSPQLGTVIDSTGPQPSDDEEMQQTGNQPSPTSVDVDVEPGSASTRVRLVPVSSIAGIVLDENGEPLAGVVVQGIAVKVSLEGRDYVPVRAARTDDLGRYAFLDLVPGDYVVRLAGEASSTRYFIGSRLNPNNDHRGLPPLYYPSGDSPASASVLHLAPGARANADFQRATEPAFDIDGRLTGFAPDAWTRIQLYRDGDRLAVGVAYVNVASGLFRVVDVPRGGYTLRAVEYQADPPKWMAAEARVIVSSEPIRNLVVELAGGADIPVSVSYEAGAQPDGMVLLRIEAQHTPRNGRRLSIRGVANARRPAEGAAEPASGPAQPAALTDVIPDRYRLVVSLAGTGTDYVASAKLGELEVLRSEFSVVGSASPELHVTIRGDSASVEGRVTLQGQPAPGARVYLLPAATGGGRVKTGYCDAQGAYRIQGVSPGDYRIQAWRGSPAAAEILSVSGEQLKLYPGEHRTVPLEAVSGSDQSNPAGGPL